MENEQNPFERFIGGQLEIQNTDERSIHRGEIASLEMKFGDRLCVRFRWLARGKGPPPVPRGWEVDTQIERRISMDNAVMSDIGPSHPGEPHRLMIRTIDGDLCIFYPKGGSALDRGCVEGLSSEELVSPDSSPIKRIKTSIQGAPVSRAEVLKALGHPSTWAPLQRRLKFRNLLRGQAKELDISGIRGRGNIQGYLTHLRRELQEPHGIGSGLISPEEDEQIRAQVIAEVTPLIAEYEAKLVKLEQSPTAVQRYLDDAQRMLDFHISMRASDPPQDESDPDMRAFYEEAKKQGDDDIAAIERDMVHYRQVLANLQRQKPSTSD